jgi:hypothetical protein
MIFSYSLLKQHIQQINSIIPQGSQIQKIWSTYANIVFQIRSPGKTHTLYLGRGAGFEAVFLHDKRDDAKFRLIDRFLEYLRKHLRGCVFQGIEIDEIDRIISLNYSYKGKLSSFKYFYCGRELYFTHYLYSEKNDEMLLFKSWKNKYETGLQDDWNHFDEVGRKSLVQNEEVKDIDYEKIFQEELRFYKPEKIIKKQKKFQKRKIKNIKSDLEKARSWELLQKFADTEEYKEMNGKHKIFNIKFNFIGLDYYEKRNLIFNKAKRLKKAVQFLEARLADTETKISKNVTTFDIRPISVYWQTKSIKKDEVKKNEFKNYEYQGIHIGVGTTSHGNDQLRKSWANRSSIWFHKEIGSSPHVIMKNISLVTQKELEVAACFIKYFNKEKSSEIDLIYTEVKNLKGIKGKPGSLNYKKEKHVKIIINEKLYHLISDFIHND